MMALASPDMLLAAGIAAGWLLAARHAAMAGVPRRRFIVLSALCVAGAVLAVLASTVMTPPDRAAVPGSWWRHMHGALLAVLLGACVPPVIYLLAIRAPLANIADIAAPSLLLAITFARVACFLKGCCWGDVCCDPALASAVLDDAAQWQIHTFPAISGPAWPLALAFSKGSPAYEQHLLLGLLDGPMPCSLPCHPVQLYETVLSLAMAAALAWWFPRRAFPLQTMAMACSGYAIVRFMLEFLRADHAAAWHGITSAQIASIALAATGALLYAAGRFSAARENARTVSGTE